MEAKLEPGPLLDILVAESMGIEVNAHGYYTKFEEVKRSDGYMMVETREQVHHYSTDIAVAFPLAIKHQLIVIPLQGGSWFCGQKDLNGSWYFDPMCGHLNAYFKHFAEGTTPAHAICLAFLALKKET